MDDRVGERVSPAVARLAQLGVALPRRHAAIAALAAGALGGCAPDIVPGEPTPGARAMFDPVGAVLPLPSGLLQNLDDGRLELPVAPAVDSPLTQEIKATLNALDGWPTGSVVTLPFDAPLEGTSLAAGGVRLVDLGARSEPIVPTSVDAAQFHVTANASYPLASAAPYHAALKLRAPAPFEPARELEPGRRYAAVVTDAVRGVDGLPVVGHPVFEFLKSTTPLVDGEGHSTTILPDADAAQLEPARRVLVGPAFDAMEAAAIVTREQAISFTVFTTQSGARPLFVPLPVGRQLPYPMDLDAPADAPLDARLELLLDRPYRPETAGAASHLYEWDESLTSVAATVETTTTADGDGRFPLRLQPNELLRPSTRYVAFVTDALETLGSADAPVAAQPGSYFTLVRARSVLLDTGSSPATLESPYLDLTLDVLILLGFDPASASPADWQAAHLVLLDNIASLESLRSSYQPLFEAVEARGVGRDRIVVLWSFTTGAGG